MGNPLRLVPVAAILAASALWVSSAQGATAIRFSGELSGLVTDTLGKPQPGALVFLYNKQDRLLQRTATPSDGTFSFGDLLPDLYSIRVTVSTFLPAAKDSIQVRAGMRSLLEVNLSRIFSTVQLISTSPAPGGLMSDSWKWTLRSDSAARPILRLLPELRAATAVNAPGTHSAIFTDSQGLIKISASDGAQTSGDGEADLGTQFAFATSLYGSNRVAFAGNVGYATASGAPSAGIRTTYRRELGTAASPTVSVTMRQIFVPSRAAAQSQIGGSSDSTLPALRTLAVSFGDKTQLSDALSLEYGFELDNVSFLDHLHYFSPYARATYALNHGTVDLTWTSGNARPELGMSAADGNADLQTDLAALAVMPRVSLRDAHVKVQRGDDYEVGLTERFGSREYRISGYQEHLSNAAVMVASQGSGLFAGDLLPDLFSNSSLFNYGSVQSAGYSASVTQDLGRAYKVALAYGSVGVMEAGSNGVSEDSAADLRRLLKASHRQALTLRASGTVKCTGTRFIGAYQWTDYKSAMSMPIFSTEGTHPEPGLNVVIRQPMPIPGMGAHVEATAELRNLLAQGYLPLSGPGGQHILLVNNPRSVRGGLAFVF